MQSVNAPFRYLNSTLSESDKQSYYAWWNSGALTYQQQHVWMAGLRETIKGLQEVETRFAQDMGHRGAELQLVQRGHPYAFTSKEELENGLRTHCLNHTALYPVDVTRETCFVLGADKRLKPMPMSFAKFPTAAKADTVFALGKVGVSYLDSTGAVITKLVHFARPSEPPGKRETFRSIGKLVQRLDAIDKELKGLGAVRARGDGAPRLGKRALPKESYADSLLCPEESYADKLKRYKATLAEGGTLSASDYAVLTQKPTVSAEDTQRRIAALFNEECEVLIKLRTFQLEGHDFEFDLPRVDE